MREIIFRGKSSETREWIYGSLIKRTIGSFIVDENNKRSLQCCGEFDFYFNSKLVKSESIGQYTGLNDNTKWEQLTKAEQSEWLKNHTVDEWNGKKIFEGDIVKCCDIKGVINYSIGCYCVEEINSESNPAIDIVFDRYENEIEVIGNIHDNPELLKGGG